MLIHDAYMDVGGTRPWKVEGRTMQDAIVESNAGAIAEHRSERHNAVMDKKDYLRERGWALSYTPAKC